MPEESKVSGTELDWRIDGRVDVLRVSSRVIDTLVDNSGVAVEFESFKTEGAAQQSWGKLKPPTFSLPQIKLFCMRFGRYAGNGLVKLEINSKKGLQRKYNTHEPTPSFWKMHSSPVLLETKRVKIFWKFSTKQFINVKQKHPWDT